VAERPFKLKVSILFLFLLCLSYIINAADRQIFPMMLTWITKAYGFNLQESGLLSTVFTLGLAIAGIPTGYFMDRSSRKTVMIVGMVIYSVFTLATVFATGFWDMLTYRAITGIGEGMQMAALFAVVGSYFHETRTFAMSCLVVAYGVGGFLGPSIGTKITLTTNDWHLPFIAYAVAGLVIAGIVLFFVPKAFSESKGQSTTSVVDKAAFAHMPENLWNRNVILGFAAAIITGFSLYGFISLYSTYLIKVLNFPPMSAGLAFSFFGLGGLMSLVGGWCGDRFNQRYVTAIAFACASAVGYVMYNVATSVNAQCFLTFLTGTFCSGFLYLNVCSLLQRSVRPDMVGRASGIFVTSLFLSAAIAGWLFAKLVESFGWGGAAMIELSLFPIIGIIATLLINPAQLITAKPKKA
jgi:MFS family permease